LIDFFHTSVERLWCTLKGVTDNCQLAKNAGARTRIQSSDQLVKRLGADKAIIKIDYTGRSEFTSFLSKNKTFFSAGRIISI
jgi:hypothetical protein